MLKKLALTSIISVKLNKKKFCIAKDLSSIRTYKSRNEHLEEISSTDNYDILIIGGGATGVGTLLNCSRKNLKTLLIESSDFGASTSTKSSKLLHGGLRYFLRVFNPFSRTRKEDLALIHESLVERDVMINNAAYMNEQVGMVIPSTNFLGGFINYFGSNLYYLYGEYWDKKIPFGIKARKPVFIFRKEMEKYFQGLNPKYKYGVILYDGQFDESRLIMDSILTSTAVNNKEVRPCNVLNYATLKSFIKNKNGKIEGAIIYDKINKKELKIKCKVAINATGVFGDQIRKMANPEITPIMTSSKGDHLSIKSNFFKNSKLGLFCPSTKDGRVMYFLPWKGIVIAGTTEKDVQKPVTHPYTDKQSLSEIIEVAKQYFPNEEITVLSQWSGLRPLVKDSKTKNAKEISRVHVIERDNKSNLLSILGGKWTIFRKMGEEVVNSALDILKEENLISDEDFELGKKRSTINLRFIGDNRSLVFDVKEKQKEVTRVELVQEMTQKLSLLYFFISKLEIQRLVMLYGIRSTDILEDMMIHKNKRMYLKEDFPLTVGEVEHLIKSEMVEIPIDLLVRRLRIGFTDIKLAKELLPRVVEIYGKVHDWDLETIKKQYEVNEKLLNKLAFE